MYRWACMRYQEIQKVSGRILYIFSTKGLIYTGIGAAIGLVFYMIFSAIGMAVVGIVITALLAFIGFAIATFKVPNTEAFAMTRKTGGEALDDIIKRKIQFQMKKNRIYSYTKEEKDGELK